MNTLVTGGAGFIGFHLCKSLLETSNHIVICADNFSVGKYDEYLKYLETTYKKRFIVKNIDLTKKLPASINSIDQIYHLAGVVGMKDFNSGVKKTFNENIRMMQNIISLAEKNNSKLLFTSTNEIYCGANNLVPTINNPETSPIAFNDPFSPRWSYAAAKFTCELLLKSSGVHHNIVRLSNVYGPRMITSYVVKSFFDQALSGTNEVQLKSPNDTRPLTYVTDTVAGIINVMNSQFLDEIFNIGHETSIKIADLINIIWDETNPNSRLKLTTDMSSNPEFRQCNASKAKALLGWKASIDIKKGIKKTLKWYQTGEFEN